MNVESTTPAGLQISAWRPAVIGLLTGLLLTLATAVSPPRAQAVEPAAAPPAPADSSQLITVAASSSSSTYATLSAWQLNASGTWSRVFGPIPARVGSEGIGQAHEGSKRTPAGTFALDQAFGRQADPGTPLPYFRTGVRDWWDENPSSPTYNLHVVRNSSPGAASENLHDAGRAYDYAVDMAVNPARTPGNGSAFFLHVGTGSPTAGCVSIEEGSLISIMRWLNPARHPSIDIRVGVAADPAPPTATHSTMTAAAAVSWVTKLYQRILGRQPDAAGLRHRVSALLAGAPSAQVAGSISASDEHLRELVQRAFVACLNRPPSGAEMQSYAARFLPGYWRDLLGHVCGSTEAIKRAHNDPRRWVDQTFRAELGRHAGAGEIYGWALHIAAGVSSTAIATQLANGSEAQLHDLSQIYTTMMHAPLNSAATKAYASAMPLGGEVSVPVQLALTQQFATR